MRKSKVPWYVRKAIGERRMREHMAARAARVPAEQMSQRDFVRQVAVEERRAAPRAPKSREEARLFGRALRLSKHSDTIAPPMSRAYVYGKFHRGMRLNLQDEGVDPGQCDWVAPPERIVGQEELAKVAVRASGIVLRSDLLYADGINYSMRFECPRGQTEFTVADIYRVVLEFERATRAHTEWKGVRVDRKNIAFNGLYPPEGGGHNRLSTVIAAWEQVED